MPSWLMMIMLLHLSKKQVIRVIQKTMEQKVELSLKWIENCVLCVTTAEIDANATATGADSANFEITDTKRYVLIVTLLAEDSAKLSKLLGEGFKRSIYWNKSKVIDNIEININNANEENT